MSRRTPAPAPLSRSARIAKQLEDAKRAKPTADTVETGVRNILETTPTGRLKRGTLKPLLLQYLAEHPGRPVFTAEVIAALGLTNEQVQYGCRELAETNPHVRVVERGQTWQYDVNPVVTNDAVPTYTYVGATKTGAVVVEGPDGGLFKLVEIQ